MTHIYVNERCRTIRALARQTLSGRWMEAIKVLLLMYIIELLPSLIIQQFSNSALTNGALSAYGIVVTGALSLGICTYFLHVFRQMHGEIDDLISGFQYVWKALALYLVMVFFIFFWTLLLIVPGIIAAFRYSQAFYILADDPGKTPMQCLAESSYMMKGNKWKYFKLSFSFFGWALLASIPTAIAAEFFMPDMPPVNAGTYMTAEDIMQTYMQTASQPIPPIIYLFSIGMVVLTAYVSTSQACFYDMVAGNLVVSGSQPMFYNQPAEPVFNAQPDAMDAQLAHKAQEPAAEEPVAPIAPAEEPAPEESVAPIAPVEEPAPEEPVAPTAPVEEPAPEETVAPTAQVDGEQPTIDIEEEKHE